MIHTTYKKLGVCHRGHTLTEGDMIYPLVEGKQKYLCMRCSSSVDLRIDKNNKGRYVNLSKGGVK